MRLETPKWNDTPTYWPQIEGWISEALTHGGVTLYPADIYNGLMTRNMKLWLIFDGELLKACCVTQMVNYQRMRCLNILAIGGSDVDNWQHFYKDVEAYADLVDCDGVEFGGRGGWSRKAALNGFKPEMTIYRKMLNHG